MSAAISKRRGPILPSTCTVGEMFHLTTGNQEDCICVATDTWECHGATPNAFPMTRLQRVATQSIANEVDGELIEWDTTTFDDNGWGDVGGADPSEITIDVSGRIEVTVTINAQAGAAAKSVCLRGLLDGVPVTARACVLTSDTDDTAVQFTDVDALIGMAGIDFWDAFPGA